MESRIQDRSLLLVLYFAPRGFSPGTPVFPSPQKPTFPNSNSTRNQVDEETLCRCATSKSLFILFINTSMRNEIIRSKTQSVSEILVLCNIPHCVHFRLLYSVPISLYMVALYQRAFHVNTKIYALDYYEHLSDLWLSSAASLRYKNRADGNQRFYLRTEALFGVVFMPAQKLSSRKWTKP